MSYIEYFLGNQYILLAATSLSLLLKIIIFANLLSYKNVSYTGKKSWFLLLLILSSASLNDLAWVVELCKSLFFPNMPYQFKLFVIRIAWNSTPLLYQGLSIFIENLVGYNFKLSTRQRILSVITLLTFFIGLIFAFYDMGCPDKFSRPLIELELRKILTSYLLLIVFPISLGITFYKLRTQKTPRLLKTQAKTILYFFIIPFWITDILQFFPLVFEPNWITNSYAAVTISTLILTYAMYFCTRRMVSLRFLNLRQHVEMPRKSNFVDGFKQVLESLGQATNVQELKHITQTYFKDSFDIPLHKTIFIIRDTQKQEASHHHHFSVNTMTTLIEQFISTHQGSFEKLLMRHTILIHDEIAFSHFYEKNGDYELMLSFLETINADIFLPIFQKQRFIGYIIVDRDARPEERFYSNTERDEMLVFASYLGNVINLMQQRNLESLMHQEKELKEELYRKHQEINQYKESIRSFLRTSPQKEIGILFYKNRRFIFGNKAAKDLIKININTQEGHPLARAAKTIAKQVEDYKSPQSCITHDADGNKLVLSGVPNLEQNNIIITVYHPEISDILKKQINHLQDPTQWDYLLYLETTKSGQLINQLIPGNGEHLLQFKIELLKTSLTKKALLLEMNTEDLLPTVELIHHISLRDTLHTLKLSGPVHSNEIALKLFGMNSIFGIPADTNPILESLGTNGTLFIQHIEHLDRESQEHLAELIRYGFYRRIKSEQRITSDVRIICSTHQNLAQLVREKRFSQELFNELSSTSLAMPSLVTLPEDELTQLADGLTEQVLKTNEFKNVLELTDREKSRLVHNRPASLQELKNKVQLLVVDKSKKSNIYNETQFNPAFQTTDPELIEAARLGKQALKDRKTFMMLWNKLQSQSKIAAFLGVNRSSVNRRCKEYGIE